MNVSNTATVIDNSTIPPVTYVSNPVVTVIRTPVVPDMVNPRIRISYACLCDCNFIRNSNRSFGCGDFCNGNEAFLVYRWF